MLCTACKLKTTKINLSPPTARQPYIYIPGQYQSNQKKHQAGTGQTFRPLCARHNGIEKPGMVTTTIMYKQKQHLDQAGNYLSLCLSVSPTWYWADISSPLCQAQWHREARHGNHNNNVQTETALWTRQEITYLSVSVSLPQFLGLYLHHY